MRNSSRREAIGGRKIPQRSCIACRRIAGKRELVRLVRQQDGTVEIDISGKKPGRAYLCPTRECLDRALKQKQVERALKSNLTEENREHLKQEVIALFKEMNIGQSQ
jgi:predicted RNA-binding protein YlxR (DUF448 family)